MPYKVMQRAVVLISPPRPAHHRPGILQIRSKLHGEVTQPRTSSQEGDCN